MFLGNTKAELSGAWTLGKIRFEGAFHNLSILNIWLSTQHNALETLNHFNIINDENLAPTDEANGIVVSKKIFFGTFHKSCRVLGSWCFIWSPRCLHDFRLHARVYVIFDYFWHHGMTQHVEINSEFVWSDSKIGVTEFVTARRDVYWINYLGL